MTENKKYPSFTATEGHKPIAGIDYDPDGFFCQDDYEYFTGNGAYSDDVPLLTGCPHPPEAQQVVTHQRPNDGPDEGTQSLECTACGKVLS